MTKRTRFSPEVQERAVRLVEAHRAEYESQWGAITSMASKIGCSAEPCARGCGARSGIPASAPGSRRTSRRGSRRWNARIESVD